MKLTPLKNKVLIELDEEVRKVGRFFMPDQDFITFCPDCSTFSPEPGENPMKRCIPEEIWETDEKKNRWIPRAIRTAHNITTVTRETAGSNFRTGRIVSVGPKVQYVDPDMTVMIGYTAGKPVGSAHRLVTEESILAAVEA